MVNNDVSHSRLTPLAFLERTALVFPDRTAVVDGERRYAWVEVRERVRRLAGQERARMKARQGVHYVTADPVRVVDEDMRDVPADGESVGEIVMRGNNVMKGYFRDEQATAEAFRGGSTIEVESALVRHPDVLEAAVVAIPDEKWGERPKGFLTLRAGATLSGEELIAFSREALPGFKAPTEIEFGTLPKTSTGKVKKYELRERVRAASPKKAA
jgi:fatty-acyl-CoA synthase